MTRIGIFFLLISWTYCEYCYLSDRELTELETAFFESENYSTRIGSNEDAIICLGATRSGKSTLINYLMGNELKGIQNSKYAEHKIVQANNESIGPEIGQGPTSKTTIPTKWTSNKLLGYSIFDAPGFDDNRGPVQDITNSFYLYLLMRNVKSLKFVLVIDFGDIERDTTIPFLKLLHNFENFFGDKFAMFFSSISVIFTKVPSEIDETEVDIEMIKHLLNKTAVAIKNVSSTKVNNFLEYIIKNSRDIALFRKAESKRIDSFDNDFNIFPAIINTISVNRSVLQNIAPSVSTKSLVCLFHAKNKWISKTDFNKIQQSLLNLFISILSDWEIPKNNTNGLLIIYRRERLIDIKKLLNNSIENGRDTRRSLSVPSSECATSSPPFCLTTPQTYDKISALLIQNPTTHPNDSIDDVHVSVPR
ncbi:uncharacterized protein LOC122511950 [Leptopilina heterotoma]|uniref:uncharacterized protein LOC122511950 n=1 Tax=Leptopilina heterotoma TaxID=63436 RepID=UPI001CA97744|nr:uncharacterized protein LOC122511950 [Leptopilina heterotoma]